MSKQAVREFDKEYHPPETLYLNYCAAVLAVVLKQHPKAKELYQDIKDCFMLPGVEDTFSMIERKVPEGTELLKGIAKKAGYKKNSKPEDNSAIAGRRLINGTLKQNVG